ncbi:MAG: prepilin-type N-terminal cleavage/methylation domain-containing protein [Pirellulaceae bacterium]|nr:prepilin-type N-terminal cleavage/methylation domain-containing protein [Pirellulaceae bacterium]
MRQLKSVRGTGGRRPTGRGFTLIEMLVAVTITLVIILAMVQVFQVVGDNVSTGRAILEMQGQLRVVALRLQQDLEGVTVPVRPWPDSFAAQGYFEYVEGLGRDWDPNDWQNPLILPGKRDPIIRNPVVGDYDDVLMFTTRSTGQPFVGQVDPLANGASQPIESKVAEVAWWTTVEDLNGNGAVDENEEVRVHRRVWLVRPDLNNTATNAVAVIAGTPQEIRDQLVAWLDANDLSVHVELDPSGAIRLVANSLADLTQRVNRMAHWSVTAEDNVPAPAIPTSFALQTNSFPHEVLRNPTVVTHGTAFATTARSSTTLDELVLGDERTGTLRLGEDVVLAKVLAFDVQLYDPTAPLRGDTGNAATASVAFTPGDEGWYAVSGAQANQMGMGAYVDLAFERFTPLPNRITTFFSVNPSTRSQMNRPAYCTWSLHYEKNGVDEDGDGLADEGTDGLDNDGNGLVDELSEWETSPPYPYPLRGIRVRIRMFEENSRQVKQVEVTSDFTPE